jgi:hypothetical protein
MNKKLLPDLFDLNNIKITEIELNPLSNFVRKEKDIKKNNNNQVFKRELLIKDFNREETSNNNSLLVITREGEKNKENIKPFLIKDVSDNISIPNLPEKPPKETSFNKLKIIYPPKKKDFLWMCQLLYLS